MKEKWLEECSAQRAPHEAGVELIATSLRADLDRSGHTFTILDLVDFK